MRKAWIFGSVKRTTPQRIGDAPYTHIDWFSEVISGDSLEDLAKRTLGFITETEKHQVPHERVEVTYTLQFDQVVYPDEPRARKDLLRETPKVPPRPAVNTDLELLPPDEIVPLVSCAN